MWPEFRILRLTVHENLYIPNKLYNGLVKDMPLTEIIKHYVQHQYL